MDKLTIHPRSSAYNFMLSLINTVTGLAQFNRFLVPQSFEQ